MTVAELRAALAGLPAAMAGERFYDEEGRPHQHDPNHTTTSYLCACGHEWTQTQSQRRSCGWPQGTR